MNNAIIYSVKSGFQHIETEPWMLNPSMTYLNHGSFGARVESVFKFQAALKRELEFSPVDFLDRQRSRLEEARQVVASFLGADLEGFGFVDNATTGVGCVLNSITFNSGDEILTTNLVYNGVRQLLNRIADDVGCSYRETAIDLPVQSSDEIYHRITESIKPATKLVVIDHVASSSSLIFPAEEIVQFCKEKGVLVLVDGAHAPGMLNLDVESVGADWYVGNLHKWVCAPLGAGFVWAAQDHRDSTHPMTVSHLYGQGFAREFDWQGTKDITPWLAAAKAVQWGDEIGWERIRKHNHSLATWMQQSLVEAWNVEPLSPLDGSMLGNMATVLLPFGHPNTMPACLALRDEIYNKFQIEVPIFELQGKGAVRVSAQLYSREIHLKQLITAIS